MHCRHCGKTVPDQAVMCVSCGVPPQNGKNFCNHCGAGTQSAAEVCTQCGVRLATGKSQETQEGKDWLTTMLLCFFLGLLGVHRFYTRHIGVGVIQLLTMGGCGVWALVDFIMILVGSYKDADGQPLKK